VARGGRGLCVRTQRGRAWHGPAEHMTFAEQVLFDAFLRKPSFTCNQLGSGVMLNPLDLLSFDFDC
jgi:hypothetical protein